MWVCKNCNVVSKDDRLTNCEACNTPRVIVLDTKNQEKIWNCMSCGKRHGVNLTACPVCGAPRFLTEDGAPGRFRIHSGRGGTEAATGFSSRISGIPASRKAVYGLALFSVVVLLATVIALNRYPPESILKKKFEMTELALINAGFVVGTPDNVDSTQNDHIRDLRAVSTMLERLALDCKESLPSAVLLEKARRNIGPDDFKSNLVMLATAVDRYLANKLGPVGSGYSLKDIRVIDRERTSSGGVIACTIEYEATLTALADVMVYRPPYLAGQEFAPLVENNIINWDNFDKFYKAYLERNTDRMVALANGFNRNRGTKICPKGGMQVIPGKMVLEKTEKGWSAPSARRLPRAETRFARFHWTPVHRRAK